MMEIYESCKKSAGWPSSPGGHPRIGRCVVVHRSR